MSDRLAELRRQRALLQEHLDRLDGEIARAGGEPGLRSLPSAPPLPPPSKLPPVRAAVRPLIVAPLPAAASPSAVEALAAPYQPNSADVQREVKRGCLLYFTAALVLLGFGVLLLYVLISTR